MTEKTRLSAACLGFLALTVFAMSGCSWLPDMSSREQPAAEQTSPPVAQTYIRMSSTAPPAPQPEMIPEISDVRNEIWRPGYWSYDNGQFSWVPGSIITKPSFTAVWSPDHWEKREYGWAFVCGYWQ